MLFAARRVPSLVIPPLSYRVATSKAKLSPVLSLSLSLSSNALFQRYFRSTNRGNCRLYAEVSFRMVF